VHHIFATRNFGPELGGMARRYVELCRRFAPDTVTVSTVHSDNAAAFDSGEPYEIIRQPFGTARAKHFTSQIRWARWLTREARAGAGALHAANLRPAGYPVWWAHRRTGLPYFLYVNGLDLVLLRRKALGNPAKKAAARRMLSDSAGVIAISAWSNDLTLSMLHDLGVKRPPPVVAFDMGTDPVMFAPSRDRGELRRKHGIGDAPLLLTVARVVPHKGMDVAIRAMASLVHRFPDLRYMIAGVGPDSDRLAAIARSLGVADRVILAGALSDAEIAEAYATATVYVGLSRVEGLDVEGFGISFIEASASGTPVVAGDSGGVRSAVRDGETGIVVAAEDVDAAASAIGTLLASEERRRAMGAAGRRAVETHYTWDRVAHDTLEFVHEMTARSVAR
jgi:phosphatidyl-myo-inositol dimannoside synthase